MKLVLSVGFALVQSSGRISPVLTLLILAALVIIVLYLALRFLREPTTSSRARTYASLEKNPANPTAAQAPALVPAAVPADDLVIIEGIGPKISGVLRAAGVTTFAQLASMEPSKIADLVHAGGIKLVDTRSWPDQARLAAAGDLAGLKDLQDHLKAGHTV